MNKILDIQNLTVGYNEKIVLKNISLSFSLPEFVVLLGENGSGKTTFFRTILGLLKPKAGNIKVFGTEISSLPAKEFSKYFAFIPQLSVPLKGFTVEEIVLMGRTFCDMPKKYNYDIAYQAMEKMNILKIKDKYVSGISGGEYQRVLFARALAQESKIMLLDEPTAHLDIKYKIQIVKLLNHLKKEKLIIAVMHDIENIRNYSDRAIFIKKGVVIKDLSAKEGLTQQNLEDVFGITRQTNDSFLFA